MVRFFIPSTLAVRAKLTILSLIALSVGSPAIAGQWTWEELYKSGNYIDAATELKADLTKGKNTAANNYYYADCLYRLDKLDKALPYYLKVYKMAPHTQYGKYSKQVLQANNRLAPEGGATGSNSASLKQRGISTPADFDQHAMYIRPTKAITSSSASSPVGQADELLQQMQRKLPKLVRTAAPRPTQAEMGGWTLSSLAGYYPTAASRVSEAESQLATAKQLLHQATVTLAGSGSPFRKFGESDQETKSRLNAASDAADKALVPFHDNVAELTSRVNEQHSILQMCVNARNSLYSTPIGFPIYRY